MKTFWKQFVRFIGVDKRRSRTVRFMFPAAIIAGTFLTAQLIGSTGGTASYVRLVTDVATVKSGDRFTLDVFVHAAEPVNAVDITVGYNPASVEVLGVDRGQSVLTIWTEDPRIEKDSVILRGGTFKKGFIGDHKIASIKLRAKSTGSSELSVADVLLLAGDGKGSSVETTDTTDAGFFVYDESTNPEEIKARLSLHIVTDIDGDGNVSLKDISSFMAAWSSRSTVYDFNNDGRMTFRDFSIILADFFFCR